jgi:putative transposase
MELLRTTIRNRHYTFRSVVEKLILTVRERQVAQLSVQHRIFADHSSTYPRRTPETRHPSFRMHGRQVYGSSAQALLANLANFSEESHAQSGPDFFVVPTATFRLLFVFLMLSHDRRRIVHFGVTSHPTAEWTAQQLRHAFPWDTVPRYILHDRDSCYGEPFHQTAQALNIQEILSAPRSPWQNAYVERLIGSIRRDCLDHVLIFNERGLRRILQLYFDYYERSRTHLSLAKDASIPRPVQLPSIGRVIELLQVGGLHHRYERRAA